MTNTAYTENNIFENPQVNDLCDYLFTKLTEAFPAEVGDPDNFYIYKGIVLSGVASNVLQGATAEDLKNIVFEIDQENVYRWLANNVSKIFNCKVLKFKERLLFYPFDKYYFEIWWVVDSGGCKAISNSGIFVQENSFINPQTL